MTTTKTGHEVTEMTLSPWTGAAHLIRRDATSDRDGRASEWVDLGWTRLGLVAIGSSALRYTDGTRTLIVRY